MKIILEPFYFIMRVYVKFSPYKFSKMLSGTELSDEKLELIQEFRKEMYQGKQDYLIPKTEEEIKKQNEIDKRSYHSVVYDERGEIVASSRFTPFPFEMTDVLGFKETVAYKDYLEISRLVCKKKKAGIGKRLLIKAGYLTIKSKQHTGFIAICRDDKCKIFEKFGLKTIGQFKYSARENVKYNFICADFFKVSTATFKHFKTKLIGRANS